MNDLLKLMQKAVPDGGILSGDSSELEVQKVSIGIPPLDMLLGGGLPRKRITLIIGDEGHGKTFFATKIATEFQKQGLSVVYVDVEHSFEPIWAAQLGLKLDDPNFLVAQPPSGEAAIDVVSAALLQGVDLVILDSAAALTPIKLMEAKGENVFVGLVARLLSPAISRWVEINQKTALVIINQTRVTIGTPIAQERLPGGRMQTFMAALIVRVRRRGWLNTSGKKTGFPMMFRVEKTKLPGVAPWSSCEVPFLFDGSLDVVEALVDVAISKGIIKQTGAHYYIWDKDIYGRNNLIALFREDTELVKMLLTEASLMTIEEEEGTTEIQPE